MLVLALILHFLRGIDARERYKAILSGQTGEGLNGVFFPGQVNIDGIADGGSVGYIEDGLSHV